MDILEQAIDFEYKGHKFYTEKAAAAKSPAVAQILENLAADELEHADFLKKLKDGAAQEFKPSDSMHRIKDILKDATMNNTDFLSEDAETRAVLEAALEIEERAKNHYADQDGESLDEGTRKLLAVLVKEEQKHYNLIQNLLKYLDGPFNILETQEFQMYDE